MKPYILPILLLAASVSFCGCGSNGNEETSDETVSSSAESIIRADISEPAAPESSADTEITSSAESSEPVITLPLQLYRAKSGYLKYLSKYGSMTAVFPEEFCIPRSDYKVKDGLLLQNKKGTASLQLESLSAADMTRRSFIEYLKANYPDAEIYITDNKTIVCKTPAKDSDGRNVLAYMMAVITTDGYNEAVLYFNEADKDEFEAVFKKISID